MANVYAIQNGNWSNGSTWSSGSVPTADDDVYCNGHTIVIPTIIVAKTIQNTAVIEDNVVAGGFLSSVDENTYNIIADLMAFQVILIQNSGTTKPNYIVNGNVNGENIPVFRVRCGNGRAQSIKINGNSNGSIAKVIEENWTNGKNFLYVEINGNVLNDNSVVMFLQEAGAAYIDMTISGRFTFNNSVNPWNYLYIDVMCDELIAKQNLSLHNVECNSFIIENNSIVQFSPNLKSLAQNNGVTISQFSNYPTEQQVAQGTVYGMQNEYEGRLSLPAESTVIKGVQYGDKVGTLEVIALSGATATAENISVVNLTEQDVTRVKNCATVSTVQKCFEDFKDE